MVFYCVYIFVIVHNLDNSYSSLSFDNGEKYGLTHASHEAFLTVTHKFFKRKDSIAVQWSFEFCFNKISWLMKLSIPTVVGPSCTTNQSHYNQYEHFDGYIFIVSADSNIIDDVTGFITYYYDSDAWQNKSEVLINLVDGTMCKLYSELEFTHLFQHLWIRFGVLNLVLLTTYTNQCNISSTYEKVWIYNPFVTTGKENSGTVHSFHVNEDFVKFLHKRLKNMNGYPLKTTMFDFIISSNSESFYSKTPVHRKGGVDVSFKWVMASYFNLTSVVHEPFDGDTYGYLNNGSYTGAVGELQRGLTDIALNSKYLRWYNVKNIYYTFPTITNSLCIIVRKSSQITGWDVIVKTFHWNVWISIIIIAIISCIFTVMFYFVENYDSKNIKICSLIDIMCVIWKPLLSASVVNVPESSMLRILMASCFLCSTVIVTVILGQIYNSIRVQQRYPDINTLEDLYYSGLDVMISYKGIEDSFAGYESPIMVELNKRLKVDAKCTVDIAKYLQKNKVAILTSTLTSKYQEIINVNSFKNLHSVKECPQHYYLAYMLPKGSVYYEAVNTLVSRIYDAGLFDLWLDDTLTYRKESSLKQNVGENPENTTETDVIKKLTYEDLELPFFILYGGLFTSVIVFVLELIWYQLKEQLYSKKQRK